MPPQGDKHLVFPLMPTIHTAEPWKTSFTFQKINLRTEGENELHEVNQMTPQLDMF